MQAIQKEDLVVEIKAALCDTFVAEIAAEENEIVLRFVNGQKFRLTVKEE